MGGVGKGFVSFLCNFLFILSSEVFDFEILIFFVKENLRVSGR